jgi:hypothetical protein
MQNPSLQGLSQKDAPSTEPSLQQLWPHLRQLNVVAIRRCGTELPQVEKDRLLQLEQVIGRRQVLEEFPMGDKHQSRIALKERDEVILQKHDALREEFDTLKNGIVQMQEDMTKLKRDNDEMKNGNEQLGVDNKDLHWRTQSSSRRPRRFQSAIVSSRKRWPLARRYLTASRSRSASARLQVDVNTRVDNLDHRVGARVGTGSASTHGA